ncbi:putative GNAT family acetyltransferase [Chaetomium fimeti]|uniref:GNAT family acetyltransferase n=1 Tax=Chaetomium fimeti TaxID=1854472 RepID=A0AAE0HLZ9_9PEZI|nr:putative GNAT family acetyltransferase [Chaetomium fimeti]
MVHAVLPALIPDIRKIYEAYFASFDNEQMGNIMLGILFPGGVDSEEFRAAHAAGTLDWWHKSDTQYTYKCVDMDTAEIVGMGLIDVYIKPRTEEERKNGGVPWLAGEQRERAEKVLNPLWEVREKLFGGRPYIYTHVIGVAPEHQGKKAGAAIVSFGIDLCNRTGLPMYFEASPTSVNMYEKFGYERLDETIVHKAELLGTEKDVVVPLMVRMPKRAGGMTFREWREKGYPDFGKLGTPAATSGLWRQK